MNKDHKVVVAGLGMVPVGEYWTTSIRKMGAETLRKAVVDAGNLKPDVLYIGNELGSILSHQANMAALIGMEAGFDGVEACTFEASGASGAAAFRAACLAVRSGFVDVAAVLGIEKVTECTGSQAASAYDQTMNYEYETINGLTVSSEAALLANRYLDEYKLNRDVLMPAVLRAYQAAQNNPYAFFRKGMDENTFRKAPVSNPPLCRYDSGMMLDGAAALILTRADLVPAEELEKMPVVLGSSSAVDSLSLHDRHDLLFFSASSVSAGKALHEADLDLRKMDIVELSDEFSIDPIIMAESIGMAHAGEGWNAPVCSAMGGCLGRGFPPGAAGAYQLAETVLQLRGDAEKCQLSNVHTALVQTVGGLGVTAITHILAN